MAVKTYLPGLLIACKFIRRYVVAWKQKLEENLPTGMYDILLAVLDGVETIIAYLTGAIEPGPTFSAMSLNEKQQATLDNLRQLNADWQEFKNWKAAQKKGK